MHFCRSSDITTPNSQLSTPDRLNNAAIMSDDEVIASTEGIQTPPSKLLVNRSHTFRKPLTEWEKENRIGSPTKGRFEPLNIKMERYDDQTPTKALCNDSSNDSFIESSIIDSVGKSNDSWISISTSRRKGTPKRLFSAKKRMNATATVTRNQQIKLVSKNSSPRLKQSTINFHKAFPIDKNVDENDEIEITVPHNDNETYCEGFTLELNEIVDGEKFDNNEKNTKTDEKLNNDKLENDLFGKQISTTPSCSSTNIIAKRLNLRLSTPKTIDKRKSICTDCDEVKLIKIVFHILRIKTKKKNVKFTYFPFFLQLFNAHVPFGATENDREKYFCIRHKRYKDLPPTPEGFWNPNIID